jgi:hypothetical protein
MTHQTAIADAMRTASTIVANRRAARQAEAEAAAARRHEAERADALEAARRAAHAAEVAAVHEAEAALRRIPEDELLSSVAADPDLREAERGRDPDLPSTMRYWLACRVEALRRAGVPEMDVCPFTSGEIEAVMAPILMSRGALYDYENAVLITDDIGLIMKLRRDCARRYGNLAEIAAVAMLRFCRIDGENLNALRRAAGM